ncbi:hypothetical protein ES705_28791 [subsurface metagenome]
MNIIWYIFIPLSLGLIFFTYAFFKWPKYALAGLIIAKPIIDVSWDYNIFLNINFLKLYAGLFVILGVIYIIVKRAPILTFHGPLLSFPRRRESSNCHPEPRPKPCAEYHFSIVSGVVPESPYSSASRSIPSRAKSRDHSQTKSPFQRSSFLPFIVSPFHFLNILWLIFLGLNVVSIFIISDAHLLLGKINYFLRILTGFIALIMFAYLFDFEKDKKFVLSIFIIAGIFPILLWLIPVLSGNPIISNDPLSRIMGPYQNFLHFNFHATQTLICCLAYLAFSSRHCEERSDEAISSSSGVEPLGSSKSASSSGIEPSAAFQRFLHSMFSSASFAKFLRSLRLHFTVSPLRMMTFIMLIVSIAMVYKCYSKTGWITLVTILFVWFLVRKKIIQTILILVIVAIILLVNPFAKDFQKTFQTEISYTINGQANKEMVFRGRLSRWETGMNDFNSLPIINKLFGAKKSIGDPENDYLRVLWDNGIIGFIAFIVLLGLTGYLFIHKYAKNKDPAILMGILIFIMYLLSSIGSYSMYYPNLQWFMWGTVGFILSKNRVTASTND